jgi:putative polyketide hydroxylase
MPSTTSVFIVGGGLNGLSTALLLAKRKVACTVVERHPTTSIQYKFRGTSPRSVEILSICRNRGGDTSAPHW